MPQRIIRTTVTLLTVCFTIPSKVVTTAHVKPTYIVWPKSVPTSLTNAWPKVFLLHAITAGCWTTVPLVELKYNVRFMQQDKPVSNFCSVRIQPFRVRFHSVK